MLFLGCLALGGLAVLIFAATRHVRGRAPAPPSLAKLGPLDPDIEDIVRQAIASVTQDPRDGLRWGRLGLVCEANGLNGTAREAYANATEMQPSEAKWPYHLAAVDARLGRVDQAIPEMRRAIALSPAYAPAFWRLGLWLMDQNDMSGAEQAFNRATDIDGTDRAGWLGLARVYLARGESERAAGLLERIVSAGPGDRYALQLLGTAYRRLGRAEEAGFASDVGIRGEPSWSDSWTDEMLSYRRGTAALLKDATAMIVAGQFGSAIEILERLQRDKPSDTVLMAHLGQVYVAAGRDADAVPLLQQVLTQEPNRFEASVDLATAYLHQNDLRAAREAVARAIAINDSYAPAFETLGLVLARAGDLRGAIGALEHAARLDPRDSRAMVWLGMVQTNAGSTDKALAAFEQAAHADPTSADAWIGIANAEISRRNFEAASVAVRNAQRIQPDRPAVKATADRLRSLAPRSERSSSR